MNSKLWIVLQLNAYFKKKKEILLSMLFVAIGNMSDSLLPTPLFVTRLMYGFDGKRENNSDFVYYHDSNVHLRLFQSCKTRIYYNHKARGETKYMIIGCYSESFDIFDLFLFSKQIDWLKT